MLAPHWTKSCLIALLLRKMASGPCSEETGLGMCLGAKGDKGMAAEPQPRTEEARRSASAEAAAESDPAEAESADAPPNPPKHTSLSRREDRS